MKGATRTKAIAVGAEIRIYEWRSQSVVVARTMNAPALSDDDVLEVGVRFENGDRHYAVWDPKSRRWESGDL